MKIYRSLSFQIAVGACLGILVGLSFGPSVRFLGELGQLLITLIKAVATPLIFLAILDAILTTEITWSKASKLLIVVSINSILAASIGVGISNLFHPGSYLDATRLAPVGAGKLDKFNLDSNALSFMGVLNSIVPASVLKPFVDNSMISVVVMGLLLGFALRKGRAKKGAKAGELPIESILHSALLAVETILGWVVRFSPFAVFGVIAKTVGEHGFAPFKGLGVYLFAAMGGMSIQIFVVYGVWIVWIAGRKWREFWKHSREPVLYSAGVNSSLATLPLTLQALERLKVSKSSARLGACVGTNLNNDGILLYEAMAVLFVAQAYGIHLTIAQQATALTLCLIAAIGVSGIPEAGVISLSLVLTAVGLPIEILPLLLAVDWIVARGRSVTNVMSDIVTSLAIDAISGQGASRWKKSLFSKNP